MNVARAFHPSFEIHTTARPIFIRNYIYYLLDMSKSKTSAKIEPLDLDMHGPFSKIGQRRAHPLEHPIFGMLRAIPLDDVGCGPSTKNVEKSAGASTTFLEAVFN
ncbi:hypothetical protein SAMD00023353_6500330 [Rosellinia necatrix]|uniref:Uncharacterized protein n=1 Tax=Rosellinia necatrix TaxID=77044 RepID=A0A1S8AAV2_ROSNE|nr:hypothetical protein SAMD00023353_6500330 [Rosellinia necatrix]